MRHSSSREKDHGCRTNDKDLVVENDNKNFKQSSLNTLKESQLCETSLTSKVQNENRSLKLCSKKLENSSTPVLNLETRGNSSNDTFINHLHSDIQSRSLHAGNAMDNSSDSSPSKMICTKTELPYIEIKPSVSTECEKSNSENILRDYDNKITPSLRTLEQQSYLTVKECQTKSESVLDQNSPLVCTIPENNKHTLSSKLTNTKQDLRNKLNSYPQTKFNLIQSKKSLSEQTFIKQPVYLKTKKQNKDKHKIDMINRKEFLIDSNSSPFKNTIHISPETIITKTETHNDILSTESKEINNKIAGKDKFLKNGTNERKLSSFINPKKSSVSIEEDINCNNRLNCRISQKLPTPEQKLEDNSRTKYLSEMNICNDESEKDSVFSKSFNRSGKYLHKPCVQITQNIERIEDKYKLLKPSQITDKKKEKIRYHHECLVSSCGHSKQLVDVKKKKTYSLHNQRCKSLQTKFFATTTKNDHPASLKASKIESLHSLRQIESEERQPLNHSSKTNKFFKGENVNVRDEKEKKNQLSAIQHKSEEIPSYEDIEILKNKLQNTDLQKQSTIYEQSKLDGKPLLQEQNIIIAVQMQLIPKDIQVVQQTKSKTTTPNEQPYLISQKVRDFTIQENYKMEKGKYAHRRVGKINFENSKSKEIQQINAGMNMENGDRITNNIPSKIIEQQQNKGVFQLNKNRIASVNNKYPGKAEEGMTCQIMKSEEFVLLNLSTVLNTEANFENTDTSQQITEEKTNDDKYLSYNADNAHNLLEEKVKLCAVSKQFTKNESQFESCNSMGKAQVPEIRNEQKTRLRKIQQLQHSCIKQGMIEKFPPCEISETKENKTQRDKSETKLLIEQTTADSIFLSEQLKKEETKLQNNEMCESLPKEKIKFSEMQSEEIKLISKKETELVKSHLSHFMNISELVTNKPYEQQLIHKGSDKLASPKDSEIADIKLKFLEQFNKHNFLDPVKHSVPEITYENLESYSLMELTANGSKLDCSNTSQTSMKSINGIPLYENSRTASSSYNHDITHVKESQQHHLHTQTSESHPCKKENLGEKSTYKYECLKSSQTIKPLLCEHPRRIKNLGEKSAYKYECLKSSQTIKPLLCEHPRRTKNLGEKSAYKYECLKSSQTIKPLLCEHPRRTKNLGEKPAYKYECLKSLQTIKPLLCEHPRRTKNLGEKSTYKYECLKSPQTIKPLLCEHPRRTKNLGEKSAYKYECLKSSQTIKPLLCEHPRRTKNLGEKSAYKYECLKSSQTIKPLLCKHPRRIKANDADKHGYCDSKIDHCDMSKYKHEFLKSSQSHKSQLYERQIRKMSNADETQACAWSKIKDDKTEKCDTYESTIPKEKIVEEIKKMCLKSSQKIKPQLCEKKFRPSIDKLDVCDVSKNEIDKHNVSEFSKPQECVLNCSKDKIPDDTGAKKSNSCSELKKSKPKYTHECLKLSQKEKPKLCDKIETKRLNCSKSHGKNTKEQKGVQLKNCEDIIKKKSCKLEDLERNLTREELYMLCKSLLKKHTNESTLKMCEDDKIQSSKEVKKTKVIKPEIPEGNGKHPPKISPMKNLRDAFNCKFFFQSLKEGIHIRILKEGIKNAVNWQQIKKAIKENIKLGEIMEGFKKGLKLKGLLTGLKNAFKPGVLGKAIKEGINWKKIKEGIKGSIDFKKMKEAITDILKAMSKHKSKKPPPPKYGKCRKKKQNKVNQCKEQSNPTCDKNKCEKFNFAAETLDFIMGNKSLKYITSPFQVIGHISKATYTKQATPPDNPDIQNKIKPNKEPEDMKHAERNTNIKTSVLSPTPLPSQEQYQQNIHLLQNNNQSQNTQLSQGSAHLQNQQSLQRSVQPKNEQENAQSLNIQPSQGTVQLQHAQLPQGNAELQNIQPSHGSIQSQHAQLLQGNAELQNAQPLQRSAQPQNAQSSQGISYPQNVQSQGTVQSQHAQLLQGNAELQPQNAQSSQGISYPQNVQSQGTVQLQHAQLPQGNAELQNAQPLQRSAQPQNAQSSQEISYTQNVQSQATIQLQHAQLLQGNAELQNAQPLQRSAQPQNAQSSQAISYPQNVQSQATVQLQHAQLPQGNAEVQNAQPLQRSAQSQNAQSSQGISYPQNVQSQGTVQSQHAQMLQGNAELQPQNTNSSQGISYPQNVESQGSDHPQITSSHPQSQTAPAPQFLMVVQQSQPQQYTVDSMQNALQQNNQQPVYPQYVLVSIQPMDTPLKTQTSHPQHTLATQSPLAQASLDPKKLQTHETSPPTTQNDSMKVNISHVSKTSCRPSQSPHFSNESVISKNSEIQSSTSKQYNIMPQNLSAATSQMSEQANMSTPHETVSYKTAAPNNLAQFTTDTKETSKHIGVSKQASLPKSSVQNEHQSSTSPSISQNVSPIERSSMKPHIPENISSVMCNTESLPHSIDSTIQHIPSQTICSSPSIFLDSSVTHSSRYHLPFVRASTPETVESPPVIQKSEELQQISSQPSQSYESHSPQIVSSQSNSINTMQEQTTISSLQPPNSQAQKPQTEGSMPTQTSSQITHFPKLIKTTSDLSPRSDLAQPHIAPQISNSISEKKSSIPSPSPNSAQCELSSVSLPIPDSLPLQSSMCQTSTHPANTVSIKFPNSSPPVSEPECLKITFKPTKTPGLAPSHGSLQPHNRPASATLQTLVPPAGLISSQPFSPITNSSNKSPSPPQTSDLKPKEAPTHPSQTSSSKQSQKLCSSHHPSFETESPQSKSSQNFDNSNSKQYNSSLSPYHFTVSSSEYGDSANKHSLSSHLPEGEPKTFTSSAHSLISASTPINTNSPPLNHFNSSLIPYVSEFKLLQTSSSHSSYSQMTLSPYHMIGLKYPSAQSAWSININEPPSSERMTKSLSPYNFPTSQVLSFDSTTSGLPYSSASLTSSYYNIPHPPITPALPHNIHLSESEQIQRGTIPMLTIQEKSYNSKENSCQTPKPMQVIQPSQVTKQEPTTSVSMTSTQVEDKHKKSFVIPIQGSTESQVPASNNQRFTKHKSDASMKLREAVRIEALRQHSKGEGLKDALKTNTTTDGIILKHHIRKKTKSIQRISEKESSDVSKLSAANQVLKAMVSFYESKMQQMKKQINSDSKAKTEADERQKLLNISKKSVEEISNKVEPASSKILQNKEELKENKYKLILKTCNIPVDKENNQKEGNKLKPKCIMNSVRDENVKNLEDKCKPSQLATDKQNESNFKENLKFDESKAFPYKEVINNRGHKLNLESSMISNTKEAEKDKLKSSSFKVPINKERVNEEDKFKPEFLKIAIKNVEDKSKSNKSRISTQKDGVKSREESSTLSMSNTAIDIVKNNLEKTEEKLQSKSSANKDILDTSVDKLNSSSPKIPIYKDAEDKLKLTVREHLVSGTDKKMDNVVDTLEKVEGYNIDNKLKPDMKIDENQCKKDDIKATKSKGSLKNYALTSSSDVNTTDKINSKVNEEETEMHSTKEIEKKNNVKNELKTDKNITKCMTNLKTETKNTNEVSNLKADLQNKKCKLKTPKRLYVQESMNSKTEEQKDVDQNTLQKQITKDEINTGNKRFDDGKSGPKIGEKKVPKQSTLRSSVKDKIKLDNREVNKSKLISKNKDNATELSQIKFENLNCNEDKANSNTTGQTTSTQILKLTSQNLGNIKKETLNINKKHNEEQAIKKNKEKGNNRKQTEKKNHHESKINLKTEELETLDQMKVIQETQEKLLKEILKMLSKHNAQNIQTADYKNIPFSKSKSTVNVNKSKSEMQRDTTSETNLKTEEKSVTDIEFNKINSKFQDHSTKNENKIDNKIKIQRITHSLPNIPELGEETIVNTEKNKMDDVSKKNSEIQLDDTRFSIKLEGPRKIEENRLKTKRRNLLNVDNNRKLHPKHIKENRLKTQEWLNVVHDRLKNVEDTAQNKLQFEDCESYDDGTLKIKTEHQTAEDVLRKEIEKYAIDDKRQSEILASSGNIHDQKANEHQRLKKDPTLKTDKHASPSKHSDSTQLKPIKKSKEIENQSNDDISRVTKTMVRLDKNMVEELLKSEELSNISKSGSSEKVITSTHGKQETIPKHKNPESDKTPEKLDGTKLDIKNSSRPVSANFGSQVSSTGISEAADDKPKPKQYRRPRGRPITSTSGDPELKGLSYHFNSQTIRGRANVAKATYALLGLGFIYYLLKKKSKQPASIPPKD